MTNGQVSPGPTIEIRLLGQFGVLIEGTTLTASAWRSRQLRTILKVLLTHRGRGVQTDQLLEILWPEEPPEKTRQRLYVRVSQLRRTLDGDHPSAYVETVKDAYRFAADADVWIDVDRFEAAAEAGHRAQEAGALESAIAQYESAQSLYQGDFLAEERGDPRAESLLAAARSTFNRSSAVIDLQLLERRAAPSSDREDGL